MNTGELVRERVGGGTAFGERVGGGGTALGERDGGGTGFGGRDGTALLRGSLIPSSSSSSYTALEWYMTKPGNELQCHTS